METLVKYKELLASLLSIENNLRLQKVADARGIGDQGAQKKGDYSFLQPEHLVRE